MAFDEFLAVLEQYMQAHIKLQDTWDNLKVNDPDSAFDLKQQYPFVEEFEEVRIAVVDWIVHQKQLIESKLEWT